MRLLLAVIGVGAVIISCRTRFASRVADDGERGARPAEPTTTEIAEAKEVRLEVLLASYQAERAQDQSSWSASATLAATGIALLGTSGFAIAYAGQGVPGWLIALLPIAPIPLFAIAVLMGNTAALRTRYLTRLEDALQEYASGVPFPVPAGYRLAVSAWHGRHGAIGQILIYVPFAGLYLALIVASLHEAIALGAAALGIVSAAVSLLASVLVVFVYAEERHADHRLAQFIADTLGQSGDA